MSSAPRLALVEQFVRRPQNIWLRKAIFQIHLWTGIALGLYVIAICVSGSWLFFRNQVMAAAPGRRVIPAEGRRLLTKDELMAAAQRAYPKYTPHGLDTGKKAGTEVEIYLDKGKSQKYRILDPYTGKDLGEAVPYTLQLTTWFLQLHRNLLAGETGRQINGVASILTTLVCISGAVIWWPGLMAWRRSLTINPRANWKRLNWELHSMVGFWTFSFFFMWSFTGIYLVFPLPFLSVVDRFMPLEYYKPISLQTQPPLQQENSVKFIPVADATPQAPPPRPRRRFVPHYSRGDMVFRFMYGAHFGNFAGLKTRIAWAILGLAPPFLFLTGALMWWNRVLSREARRLRRGNVVPTSARQVA